jgi:large subunit ribosomal protein L5
MPIGCKVTLRGARMYEFLDRLISLVLPRVRDFRGLNRKAFDGHGNYSLGLTEQLVFPELNPDKYTVTQGMNVTLVTSSDDNEESLQMLEQFGMPFKAEETEETEEPEVTKEPEAAEEDNTADDGDEKAKADPANDE